MEEIFIVQESLEGGFEAKSLKNAIFTQADSIEELRSNVIDAVKCHFEDEDMPKVIRLHFVKDEIFAL